MDVRQLEERVRLLEVARAVDEARLNELEAWRRHDEPRVRQLITDASVADQVRAALDQHTARTWSLWARLAAGLAATVTFAGGLVSLLHGLGLT